MSLAFVEGQTTGGKVAMAKKSTRQEGVSTAATTPLSEKSTHYVLESEVNKTSSSFLTMQSISTEPTTQVTAKASATTAENDLTTTAYFGELSKFNFYLILIGAGATVAVIVLLLIVCMTIFLCKRRRKKLRARSVLDSVGMATIYPTGTLRLSDTGNMVPRENKPSILDMHQPPALFLYDTFFKIRRTSRYCCSKVKLVEFAKRVELMHKDHDFMFQAEFERLHDISCHLPLDRSTLIAANKENIPKNRFSDILPFNEGQPVLIDPEGREDIYINASYIDGYNREEEYIATQGPMNSCDERTRRRKQATVNDFWLMVCQSETNCIVMLCHCMESFRDRCAQYWPAEPGSTELYGGIAVTLLEEVNKNICIFRSFEMDWVGLQLEHRIVYQWHFQNWEDARAPDAMSLLQFIGMIRNSTDILQRNKPQIVHCSAGVGRTGTYIALDHLLQVVRDHDYVDVVSVVHQLRNQRVRMVQTLEQYILLYDCLDIAIQCKLSQRERVNFEDGFRGSMHNKTPDNDDAATTTSAAAAADGMKIDQEASTSQPMRKSVSVNEMSCQMESISEMGDSDSNVSTITLHI